MAKKAFVRYDGNKKIVPGSLIVQDKAPKVGTWRELPVTDLCCNGTPITIDQFVPFGGGVSFNVPKTKFYIYLTCANNDLAYWELPFDTPPIDNITDFINYLNTNLSLIGSFEPVQRPGSPVVYDIIVHTTTTFLDSIFFGNCSNYEFLTDTYNYN